MTVKPHKHSPTRHTSEPSLPGAILFIDGEAIVLDKPSGLPVDPPRDGSLSIANYRTALSFGFQRWPEAVHRLDRDTSGCLLLARNPKAHKRFALAFEEGRVGKLYIAIIDGVPDGTEGLIDIPLGKVSSPEQGWRMTPDKKGKAATTSWRLLAERGGRSLLAMTPHTGRTHQLRVHALHGLGMPILGDPVYGKALPGGIPMMLHARSIWLDRAPKSAVEATAPMPDRFAAAGFPDAEALVAADSAVHPLR